MTGSTWNGSSSRSFLSQTVHGTSTSRPRGALSRARPGVSSKAGHEAHPGTGRYLTEWFAVPSHQMQEFRMAIATPESYNAMLDAAKAGSYAFPAINVTSSSSVTAAIQGFAAAESDGIIQVSIGGAQYAS